MKLKEVTELPPDIPLIDARPDSEWRREQAALTNDQYGIVSFPRSGHNWLSRMVAEVIRLHGQHDGDACIGRRGGMGRFVGLRCQRPSQIERLRSFYWPFPVVYGSHGHDLHDGYDPTTKCYLWRGFWSVWKSTKKAMADLKQNPNGVWWGSTMTKCLVMWLGHRWHFRHAPLKIRYEHVCKDPKAVLVRIFTHMGVDDITEETFDAAVRAGSKENMLKEQEHFGSPNPFQTVNP